MQNINELFNQIFKTSKKNYVSGNEAILSCLKKFSALKEDNISTKVLLYFFPVHPKCEKNNNEFWFCKYKNDNEYDEFDFAEDLLKNYVEYLSDKNEKNFETRLKHILLKFENYKMFTLYIYNIQGYTDNLMSTIAYFTKDSSYYLNNLNAYVSPESIQTEEFIDNLKEIVKKKIIYYDNLAEINKLQEQVNLLKGILKIKDGQEESYQKKILDLSEELLNRGKNMTAQLKALQDDKIKQDSKIKVLQEDTIKQDSKIKALQEDTIKQDSKIKALQEDTIKQDSKIKALQEDTIKQDSKIKALQEDAIKQNSKIKSLQEEKDSQFNVLLKRQNDTNSQLKNMKEDRAKIEARLKVLENDEIKLKDDIAELQNRIDKIELRDTIKLCIKNLYKILSSKFKEMKEVNSSWEEIEEIKKILSQDEFKQFQYINDFIDDIDFIGLNPLNTTTHNSSLKKGKIEDSKKYLDNNFIMNYNKVVQFFKKLPNI